MSLNSGPSSNGEGRLAVNAKERHDSAARGEARAVQQGGGGS